MQLKICGGALALGIAMIATSASADNPRDPAMRSQAARARDAAIIRGLNSRELARVQARDAQYAQGWSDYRTGYTPETARAENARRMAEWREAVARCEAGDRAYCAG
jgi:hypothetical protein